MSWNYRVIRSVEDREEVYRIHEVYYDVSDNVVGWVEEPAEPEGETVHELAGDIGNMVAAFTYPTLDAAELRREFSAKKKGKKRA